MEWFRWYGGTFGDPKLQWVARQSGCNVASVLAVWVAILERAHNHEQRGCCEGLDFESMDVALGLDDGVCFDIYQAMIRKGMIVDGDMVASWDKRQPRTEDASAAERQRNKRDKDSLLKANNLLREQMREIEEYNLSCSVTPVTECHGMSRHVTTEESRLEEKREEVPLKPQQQHAGACEQLAVVVEERQEDLLRLFPGIDIPVVVAKLLHHFRTSDKLIDPWMSALKWFQREFSHPSVVAARASPVKGKGVLREEAAIQAARETMILLEGMRDGAKQTGADAVVGNDRSSRDRTAFSHASGIVSEVFS